MTAAHGKAPQTGADAPEHQADQATGTIALHALAVGGGILAISPLPGQGGDYRGDLDHIAAWAPALVVSLLTLPELAAAGAADLGADIQDRGTRYVRLDIEDYTAPGAEAREAWPEISRQSRRALAGGGRVLLHCRGGCGRSGMAALRLMIECGEEAEAALIRLRAVRPCAVETEDQMHWARAGRAQS